MAAQMSTCMKIVNSMSEADQDALLTRLDQYVNDGVPAEQAQLMAANDYMEELLAEQAEFRTLLQEQHPDLFRAEAEPEVDEAAIEDASARDAHIMYSVRRDPPPKKTVKAYKLFRVDARKPGKLFPLFVDANTPVEPGVWLDADIGEAAKGGKVKSKIGPLAFRPGWHAGDLPIATHIGGKSSSDLTAPDVRPDNHVWAEVEMAADVDWQTEADKRGTNKDGKLVPVKAHITDQVPVDGFYRYKTNPNMTGNWLIGGSMKVNRILSDAQVERINRKAGVSDLPREQPFDAKKYGFDAKASAPRNPQVDTPEFKRWFGDSKVVDADGNPLVVYHGTRGDFDTFDLGRLGSAMGNTGFLGAGFYFTNNDFMASGYSGGRTRIGDGSNVMPVYLSLQNPLNISGKQARVGGREGPIPNEVVDAINAALPSKVDGKIQYGDVPTTVQDLIALAVESYPEVARQFTENLKAAGYDGVIFSNGYEIVAFDPAQIKSATGNSGQFDPTNPDIRASAPRTPMGFYSELAEQIEKGPGQAPKDQWKAYIKGLQGKGVKADEVEWTGITDWLDLQDGKVKKQDVMDYLNSNGVQVEEVQSDPGTSMGTQDFSGWQLPGGENYREVLLTLPSNVEAEKAKHRAFLQSMKDKYGYDGTLASYAKKMTPEERAEAKRLSLYNERADYRSSHWDQPNVLAHIRMNDRTDADGNRVLFVEEVQSDWSQAGSSARRKEVKRLIDSGVPKDEAQKRVPADFGFASAETARITGNAVPDGFGGWKVEWEDGTFSGGYNEASARAKAAEGKSNAKAGLPRAPFVQSTEGWLNLALKRIMVMAAEGGYDKVAFVNGQQSAERYDLSKQVDRVLYERIGEDRWNVEVYGRGDESIVDKVDISTSEVEDLLGKELAQKMVDGAGSVVTPDLPSKWMRLSGLDLKVGGEGMKTFYDTIVPNAVKALLKKLGGGQVESVTITEKNNEGYRLDPDMDEYGNYIDRGVSIDHQQPGFTVTDTMREKVEAGVPMFSAPRQPMGRETNGWILSRDETGRFRFGAGAKTYRAVASLANVVLDKLAMKPISTELGRAMRKMKVEIDKAKDLTADVAEKMKDLPDDELLMISDVIEGELKAGVTPPQRVLDLAASMSAIMSEQTQELVRLGMLSPDAANRWDGKYLPRFYQQKLGDDVKAWAKAARALLGKGKAMQGIGGKSLKSRGIFKAVPVGELQNWVANGWEERDPDFDPKVDTEITIWRDFTRDERDNMGEIRNAMFRFVMGYMRSQKDIALGRLYDNLAGTIAVRAPLDGYVQVPTTNVDGTNIKRYGNLAGKWVPKEVLDHLSHYDGHSESEMMKGYRKAMSMWKEGKTVLNPVSHFNNVVSNLTMAHFAGVSYWDTHKYAMAVRDLVKNDPMVQEAKDVGLFGGTFNQADLMQNLPEQLKVLAGMSESKLKQIPDKIWSALAFGMRKPMGAAYEAEDLFFRYLIYRDARKRGLNPDDATDYAQKFIFTYDDLPKGARAIRDFGMPFFAYTYKVIPAMASTAMTHPWRFAAPAAVLYGANAIFYAMAQAAAEGDEEDDILEVMRRYIEDKEFRDRVKANEEMERKNLPPWMKGESAILMAPKAIRLGTDDTTQLPMFLDVSRILPGGDLMDFNANAGGVPLPPWATISHPLFSTGVAMIGNKDLFFGRDIVDKNDTSAEAAAKRADWIWKQYAPAIAVGNYHWDRVANAVANATGEPINMGFREYTGMGRDGLPVQPDLTALNTFGVKARPIDLEKSADIQKSQTEKLIREIDAEIRGLRRQSRVGSITSDAYQEQRERLQEKKRNLRQGLDVEGNPIE